MKNNYFYTIKRNILFEIISSIELDLRSFIIEHNIDFFQYNQTIIERIANENGNTDESFAKDFGIHYLDFGDYIQIIAKFLKENHLDNSIIQKLQELVAIRNRVMHSRPLLSEDIDKAESFVEKYAKPNSFISFSNVKESVKKINKNPELFFDKTPDFSSFYIPKSVENNLPMVDYDDTGFVGREEKKKQLLKKINSSYPVISVIGVGGIGKTATVLSCIYDQIDDNDFPFEKVLWVTLKTKSLQDGEFKELKNSIASFRECILNNEILNRNGVSIIDDLLFYMTAYKTLLILDNLETINTDEVKELFENLPNGSKILITSRIGIGEYETRFELGQFDENEALYYFRRLVKTYDVKVLAKTADSTAKQYVKKLFYSPLCIKWFVINVGKGNDPEIVANNNDDVIEFCLSNVYEKLSDFAKRVLKIIFISKKSCSLAEIIYVGGQDENTYKNTIQAINELKRCNFIEQTDYGIFSIPEFSNLYLKEKINRSTNEYIEIEKKINQLKGLVENIEKNPNIADDKPYSLYPISSVEKIATIYMFNFINSYNAGDIKNMDTLFDVATKAAPRFSDLYKVAGFYYGKMHIKEKAEECFKLALEYATKQQLSVIQCAYAVFLMSELQDYESALELLETAKDNEPDNPRILSQYGRALKFNKKYQDAITIFSNIINGGFGLTLQQKKINYSEYIDSWFRYIDEIITEDSKKANEYIKLMSFVNNISEQFYSFPLYKNLWKIIKNIMYIRNNSVLSERAVDFYNKYRPYILFVIKQDNIEEFIDNLNKYLDLDISLQKLKLKLKFKEIATIENVDFQTRTGSLSLKGRNELIPFSFDELLFLETDIYQKMKVTFTPFFEKGKWRAIGIDNSNYYDIEDSVN